MIERETNKLEESIEDKNKAINCLENMLVVMEELNNALQNNTLNSNDAIKKLKFLKVSKNFILFLL